MNNTKDEIKNCFPIDYILVLKMNQKGQKVFKNNQKNMFLSYNYKSFIL